MLNGSAKNTDHAVRALVDKLPLLDAMMVTFHARSISGRLRGQGARLTSAINALYASVEAELLGRTVIPPNAVRKILPRSVAAGAAAFSSKATPSAGSAEGTQLPAPLVYELRAVLAATPRFFIVEFEPVRLPAFLTAVDQNTGFNLDELGHILHRGWGEPDDLLVAELRDQFGKPAR